MANITKELKGIVRIDTSDNYTFVLPYNGATPTPIQNSQAINNVEEVYIIIENVEITITPTIVLPSISTFNGGWNVKIYIVNKQESPKIVVPRIAEPTIGQDYINQIGNTATEVKRIKYFHIVDNNLWASWEVA